ncbi:hypothetical protein L873DRAFT_1647896, partial [Choiromyces venosus 120613-1]
PQITEVQQNHIMGHAQADVFRRHCLHQTIKVDTQSAYLGSVDRGDLVGTVGLMSPKRDPRAPVKLSLGHLMELKDYSKLAALVLQRDSLGGTYETEYGPIKAAKHLLPERVQKYNKLSSQVHASEACLERLALKDVRADWFFQAVDHDKIKQQLRGEAPSTFTFIKPEFDGPVRKAIA